MTADTPFESLEGLDVLTQYATDQDNQIFLDTVNVGKEVSYLEGTQVNGGKG